MATLAIFRPRRWAKWKNRLRHRVSLRTVTCAASTSKKRNKELPCLLVVSQSAPLSAGIFLRAQTEIAGDLLAAAEAISFPEDEYESNRRQRSHSRMTHQALRLRTFLCLLLNRSRQLAMVGLMRSKTCNRSRRRRLAQGAKGNDSSCCRPASRHNFFL